MKSWFLILILAIPFLVLQIFTKDALPVGLAALFIAISAHMRQDEEVETKKKGVS